MNAAMRRVSRGLAVLGQRACRATVLAALGVGAALTAIAQPPARTDPASVRQVHAAQQRMERLGRLQAQAAEVREAAERLLQTGRDAQAAWQDLPRVDERAQATLQQARDCLPALQQVLGAHNAALASRTQAVARSQAAVQAVAQAEGDTLAPAAHAADAAFEQRQVAEKRFAEQHHAVRRQTSTCMSHSRSAEWAVQDALRRAQQSVDLARALGPQLTALRTRWQTTTQAFAQAQRDQLLAANPVSLAEPNEAPLQHLAQALAATDPLAPQDGSHPVPNGPRMPALVDLERLVGELERLQDAVAYIDVSTAAPSTGGCGDADCAGLLAERQALATRMSDVQSRLTQALDDWQRAPVSLTEPLAPLSATRQALSDRLRPLTSALGPALTETTAFGQAVLSAAGDLASAAQRSHERERLALQRDHKLALEGVPAPNATRGLVFTAPSPAPAPAAAAAPTDIRSHAIERFSRFDAEIAGFGAYTYVLLRSASDLQTPAVRQRFQQLLRSLQTLPAAALVASPDQPHVNVFCVPVAPGNEGSGDVVYASDLGQQIKMRAQNGLLTQKAVRQRLTSSAGPFLITVPGRLARAPSGTPLLLADLSSYPPEAVADLIHHYMAGLVDDFPRQQALWQPPLLQRVALVMIHLAEGTGELVTSALPTAQAQPR